MPKETLDGISKVALSKSSSTADLDRSLESMDIAIVAGSLIRFMLFHQRQQLLSGPSSGLEVVVIRSRGASIHHLQSIRDNRRERQLLLRVAYKVDTRTTAQYISARNDGASVGKPFRGLRVVERGCLGVQLHVPRVNARPGKS